MLTAAAGLAGKAAIDYGTKEIAKYGKEKMVDYATESAIASVGMPQYLASFMSPYVKSGVNTLLEPGGANLEATTSIAQSLMQSSEGSDSVKRGEESKKNAKSSSPPKPPLPLNLVTLESPRLFNEEVDSVCSLIYQKSADAVVLLSEFLTRQEMEDLVHVADPNASGDEDPTKKLKSALAHAKKMNTFIRRQIDERMRGLPYLKGKSVFFLVEEALRKNSEKPAKGSRLAFYMKLSVGVLVGGMILYYTAPGVLWETMLPLMQALAYVVRKVPGGDWLVTQSKVFLNLGRLQESGEAVIEGGVLANVGGWVYASLASLASSVMQKLSSLNVFRAYFGKGGEYEDYTDLIRYVLRYGGSWLLQARLRAYIEKLYKKVMPSYLHIDTSKWSYKWRIIVDLFFSFCVRRLNYLPLAFDWIIAPSHAEVAAENAKIAVAAAEEVGHEAREILHKAFLETRGMYEAKAEAKYGNRVEFESPQGGISALSNVVQDLWYHFSGEYASLDADNGVGKSATINARVGSVRVLDFDEDEDEDDDEDRDEEERLPTHSQRLETEEKPLHVGGPRWKNTTRDETITFALALNEKKTDPLLDDHVALARITKDQVARANEAIDELYSFSMDLPAAIRRHLEQHLTFPDGVLDEDKTRLNDPAKGKPSVLLSESRTKLLDSFKFSTDLLLQLFQASMMVGDESIARKIPDKEVEEMVKTLSSRDKAPSEKDIADAALLIKRLHGNNKYNVEQLDAAKREVSLLSTKKEYYDGTAGSEALRRSFFGTTAKEREEERLRGVKIPEDYVVFGDEFKEFRSVLRKFPAVEAERDHFKRLYASEHAELVSSRALLQSQTPIVAHLKKKEAELTQREATLLLGGAAAAAGGGGNDSLLETGVAMAQRDILDNQQEATGELSSVLQKMVKNEASTSFLTPGTPPLKFIREIATFTRALMAALYNTADTLDEIASGNLTRSYVSVEPFSLYSRPLLAEKTTAQPPPPPPPPSSTERGFLERIFRFSGVRRQEDDEEEWVSSEWKDPFTTRFGAVPLRKGPITDEFSLVEDIRVVIEKSVKKLVDTLRESTTKDEARMALSSSGVGDSLVVGELFWSEVPLSRENLVAIAEYVSATTAEAFFTNSPSSKLSFVPMMRHFKEVVTALERHMSEVVKLADENDFLVPELGKKQADTFASRLERGKVPVSVTLEKLVRMMKPRMLMYTAFEVLLDERTTLYRNQVLLTEKEWEALSRVMLGERSSVVALSSTLYTDPELASRFFARAFSCAYLLSEVYRHLFEKMKNELRFVSERHAVNGHEPNLSVDYALVQLFSGSDHNASAFLEDLRLIPDTVSELVREVREHSSNLITLLSLLGNYTDDLALEVDASGSLEKVRLLALTMNVGDQCREVTDSIGELRQKRGGGEGVGGEDLDALRLELQQCRSLLEDARQRVSRREVDLAKCKETTRVLSEENQEARERSEWYAERLRVLSSSSLGAPSNATTAQLQAEMLVKRLQERLRELEQLEEDRDLRFASFYELIDRLKNTLENINVSYSEAKQELVSLKVNQRLLKKELDETMERGGGELLVGSLGRLGEKVEEARKQSQRLYDSLVSNSTKRAALTREVEQWNPTLSEDRQTVRELSSQLKHDLAEAVRSVNERLKEALHGQEKAPQAPQAPPPSPESPQVPKISDRQLRLRERFAQATVGLTKEVVTSLGPSDKEDYELLRTKLALHGLDIQLSSNVLDRLEEKLPRVARMLHVQMIITGNRGKLPISTRDYRRMTSFLPTLREYVRLLLLSPADETTMAVREAGDELSSLVNSFPLQGLPQLEYERATLPPSPPEQNQEEENEPELRLGLDEEEGEEADETDAEAEAEAEDQEEAGEEAGGDTSLEHEREEEEEEEERRKEAIKVSLSLLLDRIETFQTEGTEMAQKLKKIKTDAKRVQELLPNSSTTLLVLENEIARLQRELWWLDSLRVRQRLSLELKVQRDIERKNSSSMEDVLSSRSAELLSELSELPVSLPSKDDDFERYREKFEDLRRRIGRKLSLDELTKRYETLRKRLPVRLQRELDTYYKALDPNDEDTIRSLEEQVDQPERVLEKQRVSIQRKLRETGEAPAGTMAKKLFDVMGEEILKPDIPKAALDLLQETVTLYASLVRDADELSLYEGTRPYPLLKELPELFSRLLAAYQKRKVTSALHEEIDTLSSEVSQRWVPLLKELKKVSEALGATKRIREIEAQLGENLASSQLSSLRLELLTMESKEAARKQKEEERRREQEALEETRKSTKDTLEWIEGLRDPSLTPEMRESLQNLKQIDANATTEDEAAKIQRRVQLLGALLWLKRNHLGKSLEDTTLFKKMEKLISRLLYDEEDLDTGLAEEANSMRLYGGPWVEDFILLREANDEFDSTNELTEQEREELRSFERQLNLPHHDRVSLQHLGEEIKQTTLDIRKRLKREKEKREQEQSRLHTELSDLYTIYAMVRSEVEHSDFLGAADKTALLKTIHVPKTEGEITKESLTSFSRQIDELQRNMLREEINASTALDEEQKHTLLEELESVFLPTSGDLRSQSRFAEQLKNLRSKLSLMSRLRKAFDQLEAIRERVDEREDKDELLGRLNDRFQDVQTEEDVSRIEKELEKIRRDLG